MDPLETGKLLIMLAGLAGVYLKINQAVRAMSGKGEAREISNDPLKVQETIRPATIHDVERVERRVTKIERELGDQKEAAQAAREKINDQLTEMRDRIDDRFITVSEDLKELTRAVGRLEGS
jgi:chromosome segregation ATPase